LWRSAARISVAIRSFFIGAGFTQVEDRLIIFLNGNLRQLKQCLGKLKQKRKICLSLPGKITKQKI
jgi:hypothetical protein